MSELPFRFVNNKKGGLSLTIPPMLYRKLQQGQTMSFTNPHELSVLTIRTHITAPEQVGSTQSSDSMDFLLASDATKVTSNTLTCDGSLMMGKKRSTPETDFEYTPKTGTHYQCILETTCVASLSQNKRNKCNIMNEGNDMLFMTNPFQEDMKFLQLKSALLKRKFSPDTLVTSESLQKKPRYDHSGFHGCCMSTPPCLCNVIWTSVMTTFSTGWYKQRQRSRNQVQVFQQEESTDGKGKDHDFSVAASEDSQSSGTKRKFKGFSSGESLWSGDNDSAKKTKLNSSGSSTVSFISTSSGRKGIKRKRSAASQSITVSIPSESQGSIVNYQHSQSTVETSASLIMSATPSSSTSSRKSKRARNHEGESSKQVNSDNGDSSQGVVAPSAELPRNP